MESFLKHMIVTGTSTSGLEELQVSPPDLMLSAGHAPEDLSNSQGYSYEEISATAQFLLSGSRHRPKIGIICGTGLGGLGDQLSEQDVFPYKDIPNFPVSTVTGHVGSMLIGLLSGVPVLCMQGRFHFYEGYPLWKCAMPVRVMKLMGVESIIVTNAAGGLNPAYNIGDVMFIKDHVNMQGFAGDSPLKGCNDERFGPRFFAMNNAYDKEFRDMAKNIVSEMKLKSGVHEGIYVMVGGPTFETVAELRFLKILGVDAVGMSTVPEVVVAKHCGLKVFAFSLITNRCIMDYDTDAQPSNEELLEVANQHTKDLQELVRRLVVTMNDKF